MRLHVDDWPEWSLQLNAYMVLANPKSIAALRGDAGCQDRVVQQIFEQHNAQLQLALALLCKDSALATVQKTEVNNGLEAWRGLNATHDSNNEVSQRVRMQYLLQQKKVPSRFHRRLERSRDLNAT